ncbi:MAG: tetratricopeptide repeat protein [Phycisphaerales bacterium]|nr:tetratricopeptide repeat protein [Phycisphaerales bacterium]
MAVKIVKAPQVFHRPGRGILSLAASVAALGASCSPSPPKPAPLPEQVSQADPAVREAIEEAWTAATTSPESVQRRLELSLALDANGFDNAAAQSWQAMELLAPRDGRAAYFLAQLAADRGDLEQALVHMDRVFATQPDFAPACWRAGFWQLDLGRPDEAAALFQRAAEIDPSSAAAMVGLARADLARDRTTQAIETLGTLLQKTGHPYSAYLLAQALRRAGRLDEAAAIQLSGEPAVPQYPDPWNRLLLDAQRSLDGELGRIDRLLADGRIDDARLCVGRALTNWPNQVHLLNRLGEVHRRNNDAAAWVRTMKRAVLEDPKSFQSHLNLSMAFRQAGEHERALQSAMKAAQLRPDLPDGHLQLARMHLLEDRLDAALPALDRAFELGVTNPAERLQYAHLLLRSGRLDDAVTQAELVVRTDPRQADGWVMLALAHRDAGRVNKAIEAVQAGLNAQPDHAGLRRLARELIAGGASPRERES